MKRLFFIITCFFWGNLLEAQIVQQNGTIYSAVSTIISSMPGSTGNQYADPSTTQLVTWDNIITNLLQGNYNTVADSAASVSYQLVQLIDTSYTPNRTYYMLKNIGSNYWGTYVYYPDYVRPLVIQSPHSKKDANTGHQGIYVFRTTRSMFYCLNGTHRCNSSAYTSCTGTTTGCANPSEPYRVSDMSHTITSVFQKSTEVLLNTYSNTHFIQLHGFTKLSTDPYVILSNGTQSTPSPDYLNAFATNLYNQDTTLTFKIAHIDTNWTRLRGFWNTQSRMINASTDPCNTNATNTNGRFFHVEQEKTKLRDNTSGWSKVAWALVNTFPAGPLPVSYDSFIVNWLDDNALIQWSTSEEFDLDKFDIERSVDANYYNKIGEQKASQTNSKLYNFVDKNAAQLGFDRIYYRLRQYDLDGKSSLSKTIVLQNRLKSTVPFVIYPNPSSGSFTINNSSNVKQLAILNSLGQHIRSLDAEQIGNGSIELTKFPKGLYYVIIQDKFQQQHILNISIR